MRRKKSTLPVIEMRPRGAKRTKTPLTVTDMLARELRKVEKLSREEQRLALKLQRSKLRYQILKQLATNGRAGE